MLDRHVYVENGKVKMKWGVGGKSILLIRLKYFGAPINKAGGVAVREHNAFGLTG